MRGVTFDPRILFVDQTGKLGGAEFCLADLVVHLRERCTVLLFESGPFQELLERNKVATVCLAGASKPNVTKEAKLSAYFLALPAFVSLLFSVGRLARGFDVLYANTAKALVATAVVGLVLRKPFLFHLHDIIDSEHFSRLNRWLLVAAANLASGIVANSEATAEAYRKAGGRNRNLVVLPNGFEVERFSAEEESVSREIRASMGCKEKPLVGVFGRITAWKGQKVLIEALSNLPDVTAAIVGEALFTEEDQEYKRELTVLADHLGVADRVHFTGFQRDVLPFLKAVDLVVHCSTSPEPFGRVIVEALLAGKPVIATRHGAPAEIIEDGVTGVLVSPGDPVLLAEAMERLLADRPWAEKLARAGRDSAGKRFSLDRVLAKWTEFINRTVQGPAEPEPQVSDPAGKRAKGREVRLTGA